MTHLLVTNDFPPKVGGIQSFLWELWRRLPPERVVVVTASYPGDRAFDARQRFRVERLPSKVLLPVPSLVRRVRALADEADAGLVMIDPALPLGLAGPRLGRRYGLILHGAELAVPARLPLSGATLRRLLSKASVLVAGGEYVATEARRLAGAGLNVVKVPPGVDTARFRPASPEDRRRARAAAGLPPDGRMVLALSRLVPRKGFDVVIEAAALLAPSRPDLVVAVVGRGRDRARLERLARSTGAPVRFLGSVAEETLPALVAAADVLAVPCRSRWAGLEQEGFGIVFLEAAACGVPAVAGRSGGAAEAVADGETGAVVDRPQDPRAVAAALGPLLDDADRRAAWGRAARLRAEQRFRYDHLAAVLDGALAPLE
ncbi:MAG TPA: glycosyltransferase family 4 protein [Acidimicrobiales bacterium]|nr:glycosyltransferase family 4 protein [Acidimicrobiales bacterium]